MRFLARTVVISEQELDLMLNYAASRFGRGAASASMAPGTVRLQASAEIPQSPFGHYVNVDVALRETGALPRFDHLRIGRLPVPATVAAICSARACAGWWRPIAVSSRPTS